MAHTLNQLIKLRDATIEVLARQSRELELHHVQPTAVPTPQARSVRRTQVYKNVINDCLPKKSPDPTVHRSPGQHLPSGQRND